MQGADSVHGIDGLYPRIEPDSRSARTSCQTATSCADYSRGSGIAKLFIRLTPASTFLTELARRPRMGPAE